MTGKVRVVRGTDRYITLAVDECDNWGMKGIMFPCDDSKGIPFSSLLEMMLNMDRVFDSMGCAKQTFQMRYFPGTNPADFVMRTSEEKERKGKRGTFRVYVQYRYYASWQGLVEWEEGNQQESFESTLQLICFMNQMLNGPHQEEREGELLNFFDVAVDAYDSGRIVGNYQNIPADLAEQYELPVDLAGTLWNFMQKRVSREKKPEYEINYGKLISNQIYFTRRRGGRRATFSIKIMFREHCTWQGIIYWQEGRAGQPFRSFREMLYLMVSAVGTTPASGENYEEEVPPIASGL